MTLHQLSASFFHHNKVKSSSPDLCNMCGRFSLFPNEDLPIRYASSSDVQVQHRYNIAPGQKSVVVLQNDGATIMKNMKWGLPIGERNVINLRKETLMQKKHFQGLFENQRCLIPVTGFYEWRPSKVGKIPFFFHIPDLRTFSLGGVWMQDQMGEQEFAVITLPSQPPVSQVHHRMPLFIDQAQEGEWLNGTAKQAMGLMDIRAQATLRMHQVAPTVNDPINDGPQLVQPVMRLENWSR